MKWNWDVIYDKAYNWIISFGPRILVGQVAGIQLTFFAAIVAGFSVAAGLALSGTIMTVNVWVNAHGYYDLLIALNEKLISDIKKAGIHLPGT